jgi:hypothetical protein
MSPVDDLHGLPPVHPPATLDASVRRAAHAALAASSGPRWRAVAIRTWTHVMLPAAVTVTVVGYLSWAFETASHLVR